MPQVQQLDTGRPERSRRTAEAAEAARSSWEECQRGHEEQEGTPGRGQRLGVSVAILCAGGTLLLPVSNQSGGHRQDILSHRAWSQAPPTVGSGPSQPEEALPALRSGQKAGSRTALGKPAGELEKLYMVLCRARA